MSSNVMQPSLDPIDFFPGRRQLQDDRVHQEGSQLAWSRAWPWPMLSAHGNQVLASSGLSLTMVAPEWVKLAFQHRHSNAKKSIFELESLKLGKILKPLEYRDILDEMLDDTRS